MHANVYNVIKRSADLLTVSDYCVVVEGTAARSAAIAPEPNKPIRLG